MSDDHDHHVASSGWTLAVAIGLTLGFAVIEALAGWWSGSLALASDAGHMFTDGGALALAGAAAWLAKRPQSHRHTYGFARAEILAGFLNAFFMLAVIAAITVSAIERLRSPGPIAGEAVTVVAVIGLMVNLACRLGAFAGRAQPEHARRHGACAWRFARVGGCIDRRGGGDFIPAGHPSIPSSRWQSRR